MKHELKEEDMPDSHFVYSDNLNNKKEEMVMGLATSLK